MKGRPRAVTLFPFDNVDLSIRTKIQVFTDTDWAGCKRTRRSTTDGCILCENRLIKSWSTTQTLIALSSGEAELYGTVKAGSEGLGVQALLKDLGIMADVEVLTDASAAIGILDRKGLGRLRHAHTLFLLVQEAAAEKRIRYLKTKGTDNCSDLLTKHVPRELIDKFCKFLNVEIKSEESAQGYKIASMIKSRLAEEEEELKTWMRIDYNNISLRGSGKEGPRMEDVKIRETIDIVTGEKIMHEDLSSVNNNGFWKHRTWSEPCHTLTALHYVPRCLGNPCMESPDC